MAYLTENRLSNLLDVPLAIPSTELKMGDWVIMGSVRIIAPMRLTYKFMGMQVLTASVTISNIDNSNLIFGNLGLVYVTLRRDYQSGSPGEAGALDVLVANNIGNFARDVTSPVIDATPGVYSWILANNMQPSSSTDALIPPSTSIDFRVTALGMVRVELDNS